MGFGKTESIKELKVDSFQLDHTRLALSLRKQHVALAHIYC